MKVKPNKKARATVTVTAGAGESSENSVRIAGVTVFGTVRDAENQVAKQVYVCSYTKSDVYGRYNRLDAKTGADGYSFAYLLLMDSYGSTYYTDVYDDRYDSDRSMVAYLRAGSYDFEHEDDANVDVWGEMNEYTDDYGNQRYSLTKSMGKYKIEPVSFQVGVTRI